MRYLVILFLLSSCSAVWHINRAVKKDPSIIQHDAITIRDTIEKSVGSAVGFDSLVIDNDRLWLKAIASGKISLEYTIKEQVIENTVETPKVISPKSRQQVRQEEKTKRTIAKQTGRTDRKIESTKKAVAKSNKKKENHTPHWKIAVVFFAIGLIIRDLLRLASKINFSNFVK